MPIATPEVYAEMLGRAKEHSFAFPAINCTSSETINAAHEGIRRRGQRRHHPVLDRWRRVRVRPGSEGHGRRRGRAGRVRARRRGQVPDHRRAAHRPLPEGQARHLRAPAAGDLGQKRVAEGQQPAVPVAHVGRLGGADRREPRDRQGTAEAARPPPRSSSRSRSASSAARRTASRPRSTRSCTPRRRTSRRPSMRSARASTASTCSPRRSAMCTACTSRATSSCAPTCSREGQKVAAAKLGFGRRRKAVRLRLPRRLGLAEVGDRGGAALRRGEDERRHRHPVRVHPPGRRAHVHQLRRRAEDRRRGRQQEGLRPAQLPEEGRGVDDRARRRGVQGPAQRGPVGRAG